MLDNYRQKQFAKYKDKDHCADNSRVTLQVDAAVF